MLGAAEIRSHPFGSGLDFLEALPDLEPGCILLDLRMPQMDGFEVMEALAERKVDWPVIVMTGHGEVPVAVRAMKLGAVDFIEKPFSEQALLGCFSQAFALLKDREAAGRRRREAHERAALLTGREKEVLQSLLAGQSNKEIAQSLGISLQDGRDAPRQHDGPAPGLEPRRGAHPRARGGDHPGRRPGRLTRWPNRPPAPSGARRGAAARERGDASAHARADPADRLDDRGRRQRPDHERALSRADRHRRATTTPQLSIHPDDRDEVLERWAVALQSGTPFDVECRLRMKDGSYRFFHVRARAAARRAGPDRALVRHHRGRPRPEAGGDRPARHRGALPARGAGDQRRDLGPRFHHRDDRLERQCRRDPRRGAAAARPHAGLLVEGPHPSRRETEPAAKPRRTRSSGGSRRWSGTYRFRRDDGSYADVLDRGFIIRDADGRAIRAVGAIADLTERHRAEAEIRRMQAELIHVSRLSAMGAMASTLAHELNQPLAAVTNFVSGAKRIAENPRRAARRCSPRRSTGAETAARRAGEILRRVRDLVSRGKVAVQVEHLPQLIDEACVLAFIDAEALGIPHRLELDPAAQWVRADRIQIQQVLINLVRNAVEAIGDGAPARDRHLDPAQRQDGRDRGRRHRRGHRASTIPTSLFSEFLTTKSGGMGIGLPISRTIVEAHGGQIWGENRPGGGAVFRFTLPRARPRRQGARLTARARPILRSEGDRHG